MKKKLEAELISIAHRILKLKNKSELVQLHQETQKLYEKLSVLRFWEENFSDVKPTIGHAELEEKLELGFENNPSNTEIETETQSVEENETEHSSPENYRDEQAKQTNDDVNDTINEKEEATSVEETKPFSNEIIFDIPEPKAETPKLTLEDLLSDVHSDPVFERVAKSEEKEGSSESEQVKQIAEEPLNEIEEEQEDETDEEENEIIEDEPAEEEIVAETEETPEISEEIIEEGAITPSKEKSNPKNGNSKKTITLGLNDRIAFEKHLFGGSAADLNRVISQLITYDTFQEAQDFIEDMVKPDYHNWEGKEEYALRFMDIVEKKFN